MQASPAACNPQYHIFSYLEKISSQSFIISLKSMKYFKNSIAPFIVFTVIKDKLHVTFKIAPLQPSFVMINCEKVTHANFIGIVSYVYAGQFDLSFQLKSIKNWNVYISNNGDFTSRSSNFCQSLPERLHFLKTPSVRKVGIF